MKLDYSWKNSEDYKKWGPYLSFGRKSSSEIRISWRSRFYSLINWIQYGQTPKCETRIEEKTKPTRIHCFIIKHLKPNTTYYYKISRSEDLVLDEPPIYIFTTGPNEKAVDEFEFCVASDLHAKGNNLEPLVAGILRNVPHMKFITTCGDCVNHGGEEGAFNNFFFQMEELLMKYPIMHTTGNHDSDHPESYAHFIHSFHHPYYDIEKGAFYYYIYGNTVFIMLDSDNAGQTQATQGVVSDEQYEWLENTLEKYAKKDYWIFIFVHHQIYSTGDFGMMHLYELAYKELFDEYHVDAIFYGHDHHFDVYWTERDSKWGGSHYFLVGNGGGDLDKFNMDVNRKPYPNYLWKGRTFIPDRDGNLPGNPNGARNDNIIENAYIYGIIEKGFSQLKIKGDVCEFTLWGFQNQLLFKDTFKRTGTGKKYHTPEFRKDF